MKDIFRFHDQATQSKLWPKICYGGAHSCPDKAYKNMTEVFLDDWKQGTLTDARMQDIMDDIS